MTDSQPANRPETEPAVVTLPAELDLTNTRHLGKDLGSALASGAAVVVADMTATVFCDCSWIRILALAGEQAAASGIDWRLVVPSSAVQRTLTLVGLDGMLPIYPTLGTALATASEQP